MKICSDLPKGVISSMFIQKIFGELKVNPCRDYRLRGLTRSAAKNMATDCGNGFAHCNRMKASEYKKFFPCLGFSIERQ